MNTDPGILCFQHCCTKVFCFEIPQSCPVCRNNLEGSDFEVLPFRVPYPFVRAAQYPCSVVIKPTSGDFLNDYLNSMDLHIGVTDSKGVVVEFDKNGLQTHDSNSWSQCLVLAGLEDVWCDYWDSTLKSVCESDKWTVDMYDEKNHNCYTFVLAFLQQLNHENLSYAASSKTKFCEKFIVPHTTAAGKYISLYRRLRSTDDYIYSSYLESIPSR